MSFFDNFSSFKEAEKKWDEGVGGKPIRKLKVLPDIPGITEATSKNLRWKSFKYMTLNDKGLTIFRHFFKRPLHYGVRFIRSCLKKSPFKREGDFFFYGLDSIKEFLKFWKNKDTLLVVGFSYCEKPHECPSGRFTDKCIKDPENSVCRQCEVGKIFHALPKDRVTFLVIPTIHYIGDEIFKILHKNPKKKVLFLITACELTLNMFADYGNMAGIKGIGVRLDGRICNTMKAFELSEKGIKPGLTILTAETRRQILDLCEKLRSNVCV